MAWGISTIIFASNLRSNRVASCNCTGTDTDGRTRQWLWRFLAVYGAHRPMNAVQDKGVTLFRDHLVPTDVHFGTLCVRIESEIAPDKYPHSDNNVWRRRKWIRPYNRRLLDAAKPNGWSLCRKWEERFSSDESFQSIGFQQIISMRLDIIPAWMDLYGRDAHGFIG